MFLLGVKSLPITVITAVCIGLVFAVQTIKELAKFAATGMVGGVMGLALWRELSPLLIGVVVAGRIASAIAAELGTMKVTEQLEALEVMSQDSIKFLVLPRVIAGVFLVPLLTGVGDVVSFLSGFAICFVSGQVNPVAYFDSAQNMLVVSDIGGGLIKACFFGFVITFVGCFYGLRTQSGAKGVGDGTTQAVVVSLVVIFISNYFLSLALF